MLNTAGNEHQPSEHGTSGNISVCNAKGTDGHQPLRHGLFPPRRRTWSSWTWSQHCGRRPQALQRVGAAHRVLSPSPTPGPWYTSMYCTTFAKGQPLWALQAPLYNRRHWSSYVLRAVPPLWLTAGWQEAAIEGLRRQRRRSAGQPRPRWPAADLKSAYGLACNLSTSRSCSTGPCASARPISWTDEQMAEVMQSDSGPTASLSSAPGRILSGARSRGDLHQPPDGIEHTGINAILQSQPLYAQQARAGFLPAAGKP